MKRSDDIWVQIGGLPLTLICRRLLIEDSQRCVVPWDRHIEVESSAHRLYEKSWTADAETTNTQVNVCFETIFSTYIIFSLSIFLFLGCNRQFIPNDDHPKKSSMKSNKSDVRYSGYKDDQNRQKHMLKLLHPANKEIKVTVWKKTPREYCRLISAL